jgi:uncharacterized coiled-coil DUF342 family protein
MNKERRKRIEQLNTKLSEAKDELEAIKDEEQEYYDNMPEGLQSGEKGEKAQEAVDCMDEGVSNLETLIDGLNDAIG